jgi:hypothetical protein
MQHWNFQQPFSVFTFVGFVFMAQVVLPWKNVSEWGPFFDWSLFSKSSVHWNFFDLEVGGPNGTELYSSSPKKETETWYNLQRFAAQVSRGEPITDQDFLFSHLKKRDLTPVKIYKIKVPLQRYILLNQKEKIENAEEIFKF